jgi:predicted RNA-binding protein associated with RNAse of E/G family
MKYYTINGVTTTELPKILRTPDGAISPVSEETFTDYGGVITEDEKLTPKEAVIVSLNTLIHELATQVQGITIAEFKQAAKTMISSDLINYARAKEVPEEIIKEARGRVVEIMADALRMGISWNELIDGITE